MFHQVSALERSAVLETASLRAEVEERVAGLAGQFREAAAAEMHSTTRRALHHNQVLTSLLGTLRARLAKVRDDNHKYRAMIQESKIRENVQKKTVIQLAEQGQKRAALLKKVTERAEQHAQQHQADVKSLKEAEQLRKDLRLQQAQLDATTELTSQLKEKATERDIALELTAARLQEEDAIKKSLLGCIRAALNILQRATFQQTENAEEVVAVDVLLKQLVELLTIEEQKAEAGHPADISPDVVDCPDPLLTYSAGDLGLLPKTQKRSKKDSGK